jgi:arylformamidase
MSDELGEGAAPRPAGRPIDVSVTIRPRMPIYPGDPGVSVELARSMEGGDPANVSRLELGAHTGTHIDAPRHFIPGGPGVDELPLSLFVGPCVVADATNASTVIDAATIESLQLPTGTKRSLLKTSNSALWDLPSFVSDSVRLNETGAMALIDRGVRLVGIDYLSIGDPPAHRALLARGVGVIEGVDLRNVDPGAYFLACLPLKIAGGDGAPARAVLWRCS